MSLTLIVKTSLSMSFDNYSNSGGIKDEIPFYVKTYHLTKASITYLTKSLLQMS